MGAFGELKSVMQIRPAGTVVDLDYSIIKPKWAQTNLIKRRSVITGVSNIIKRSEDLASFDVILNVWKNAAPAATMLQLLLYNHLTVWFKPHSEMANYIQTAGEGEIITNGTLDVDSGWNTPSGITISGGAANYDSPSQFSGLNQTVTTVAGVQYKLSFDIKNYVSGSTRARLQGGITQDLLNPTSGNGRYAIEFVASGNSVISFLANTSDCVFSLDNISIQTPTDAEFYITKMLPFYFKNEPPELNDKLLISLQALVPVDPISVII